MDTELLIHVQTDQAELMIDDHGVLAFGASEAVERLLASLEVPSSESTGSPLRPGLVSGLTAVNLLKNVGSSQLEGLASPKGQFFQFSPETLSMLKSGLTTDAGHGFFNSGIQGADGKFLGNIKWKAVDGPVAMSPQIAIAMAALELAIRDVQSAVERVEQKVDEVRRRINAQQFGDVVGRHTYLQRQIELLDQTGHVNDTDWFAIASLGPNLSSDLARLRAYVQQTITDGRAETGTDDPANAVERLVGLEVELDLLTVAERSQFYFESLRLQHLSQTDPHALAPALVSARRVLDSQHQADRELIGQLKDAGESLTRVGALEIHRIFSRRQLEAGVDALNEMAERFALSRSIPIEAIPAAERPTPSEAVQEARKVVVAAGATSKKTIVDATAVAKTLLNRSNEDDQDRRDEPGLPPALGSGNEAGTSLGTGSEDPATRIGPTSAEDAKAESETRSETESEIEVEAASDQVPSTGSRLRRGIGAVNEKRAKPPRPPF
ncbi:MAG: hypothetical protein WBB52_06820 [Acidimicrobiales bacterium]